MKNQPKVSIIIPVYNGSNYLAEAIDSALAQTYKNIEIIVVNDGSNDGGASKKIALSYGKKIKYYEKQNGGAASALNYGIEKMTGKYFSWLSHDDIYLPDKVKKEVEMLLKHKNYEAVIACNVNIVDENLVLIRQNKISNIFNKAVDVFLGLDIKTGLNGCSLLIPKSLFEKVGVFDTELRYTQDYDMWYRLSKVSDFYLVNDNLVLSRQHSMQDSVTKTDGCTIESDKLHYLIISEISEKELLKAYNKDVDEILGIYDIYYKSGYLKTAAIILAKILEHYKNNKDFDRFNQLLKKNVKNISNDLLFDNSMFFRNDKNTLLFYSNVWVKGGIERVLTILSDQLVEKYNVVIVSGYNKNNDGYELNSKVKHINVDNNSVELNYSLLVLCLIYNVDIFVGNPNIINSFLDIYEVLKETNIKTVAYNHYYYFLPYYASWIYSLGQKRMNVYKNVDACIWLTDFNAKIGNLFHENGVTIPNPNIFEIVKPKEKKEKIILAVGRFYDEIKRIDRILKTFRLILNKDPQVKLVLVGGYDLNLKIPHDSNLTVKQLLKKLKFPEGSIVWAGEQVEVESYYSDASVLMLTSENEGFALVVLEAVSFGLPCAIFEIPGIDSVKNNYNGFVVQQDDYVGLANRTLEILNNKDLYNEMSKASLAMAENYKMETIIKKWEDLINLLVQNKTKQEIREDIKNKYVDKSVFDYNLVKTIAMEYEKSLKIVTSEYERLQNSPFERINYVDVDKNNFIRVKRWIKTIVYSIKKNGLKTTLTKIKKRIKAKVRSRG